MNEAAGLPEIRKNTGHHAHLGSEISANESTLETNVFLNPVYRPHEDKWLFRGMIFGGLVSMMIIVMIIAYLALNGKEIPDALTVLPTGILGFVTGIFYGKATADKSN